MAGEDRSATSPLAGEGFERELAEKPWSFGFYYALRLLEARYRKKPRIGTAKRLADDPVRIGQEPSMAFAPSTLSKFVPGGAGGAPRLFVNFLGLLGPNGALPLHLTEYAYTRERHHDDETFSRFLDIFHHRILSIYYRIWSQAQPTVSYDRPDEDRFSGYVGSLFGIGMKSLRKRDDLQDNFKLHFAGRFSCQTRHADGLRSLLSSYFELPVEIEECVGQWMRLPPDGLCRLGSSPDVAALGRTAIAGSRVWDCQLKFRIVFGPLSFEDFGRLLPGAGDESVGRLVSLVRNYIGDELMYDVQLILKKEEVPPLRLGEMGQLGWTTWASSRTLEKDADQVILDPLAQFG